MVELVDAPDSKSGTFGCEGSIPSFGTERPRGIPCGRFCFLATCLTFRTLQERRVQMTQQQDVRNLLLRCCRPSVRNERGSVPVVVLDLDLTLLDNRARTRAILRDFVHGMVPDVRTRAVALERLETHSIVYSIQENMKAIGVDAERFRQDGLFLDGAIFSDRFCSFDTPYPGAAEACSRMLDEELTWST